MSLTEGKGKLGKTIEIEIGITIEIETICNIKRFDFDFDCDFDPEYNSSEAFWEFPGKPAISGRIQGGGKWLIG
jgi:hypothetical protein